MGHKTNTAKAAHRTVSYGSVPNTLHSCNFQHSPVLEMFYSVNRDTRTTAAQKPFRLAQDCCLRICAINQTQFCIPFLRHHTCLLVVVIHHRFVFTVMAFIPGRSLHRTSSARPHPQYGIADTTYPCSTRHHTVGHEQ